MSSGEHNEKWCRNAPHIFDAMELCVTICDGGFGWMVVFLIKRSFLMYQPIHHDKNPMLSISPLTWRDPFDDNKNFVFSVVFSQWSSFEKVSRAKWYSRSKNRHIYCGLRRLPHLGCYISPKLMCQWSPSIVSLIISQIKNSNNRIRTSFVLCFCFVVSHWN